MNPFLIFSIKKFEINNKNGFLFLLNSLLNQGQAMDRNMNFVIQLHSLSKMLFPKEFKYYLFEKSFH